MESCLRGFYHRDDGLVYVLWILGSEDELLEQLEEYFKIPSPFTQEGRKYIADLGEFSGNSSNEAGSFLIASIRRFSRAS